MSTPFARLFRGANRTTPAGGTLAGESVDAYPEVGRDPDRTLEREIELELELQGGAGPAVLRQVSSVAGIDFGAIQQGEEMVAGIDALLIQLSLAYDQQARLIRGIGHDFKSPLSSVLHLAESLESGDFGALTPEQSECVRLISQSARLLTAQAQALYALGEARSGDNVMGRRLMDLTTVLAMVADVSAQRAEVKGIDFSVELPDRPLWVSATLGAVERILDNAVGNAIKYTEVGAVNVRVVPSTNSVTVFVTDSGIGIPAGDIGRLGVDYGRAGNAEEVEGTGVGLVVTNHLLTALGGHMKVESVLGEGTTIELVFPLAKPDNAAEGAQSERGERA